MSNRNTQLLTTLIGLTTAYTTININSAHAAIINGSFENSFSPNWSIIGDVERINTFSDGPTDGNFQAILTTASPIIQDDAPQPTGTFNFSGNSPTAIATLESFLGVTSGTLTPANSFFGAFEGSAIQQTFTANAGDILTFDWNFLTNDTTSEPFPGFVDADYAFLNLVTPSGSQLITLANTDSTLASSSTIFNQETGYQQFSLPLNLSGSYTLSFGVLDAGGTSNSSALLIDNVELSTQPQPTSTPEPTTILTLLGMGVLGGVSRLKRPHK